MNMFYGGKTPLVPASRLKELGYSLIIIPFDLQRAAIKAVQMALKVIALNGDSSSIENQLATFQEREEIIQTEKFLKFEYSED
jgi:2-methylisocitrate lyase-like PEP mutase family enzyme